MAGIGLISPPERTGRPTRLSADGYPTWMDIGVTIAWELVAAASSVTTLADGTPVAVGDKVIEHGTTLVKVTSGSGIGKYAPFDSSKSNGQQTLTRGDAGLLDNTIKQQVPGIYNMTLNTEFTGLIIGGLVFRPRLKVGGSNQPTLTNLMAALPLLQLTRAE